MQFSATFALLKRFISSLSILFYFSLFLRNYRCFLKVILNKVHFILPFPPFTQAQFTDECKFKETLLANNYNAYESVAYPGMYIGLSRTGKTKKGNRVSTAMTVTHFLPRI